MPRTVTVLLAGVALAVSASAQEELTPNELIETTASKLLDIVEERRDELASDNAALYQVVDDLMLPHFDTVYAAKLILGRRHWTGASEAQQQRFIDAFYQNLRNTYADGLLEFSAQSMNVLPFQGDLTKRSARVRTQVTLNHGKVVPVDYRLRRGKGGGPWMVWDVVVEGISYVKSYSSDLGAEIDANGLDAVIERLEREAREAREGVQT